MRLDHLHRISEGDAAHELPVAVIDIDPVAQVELQRGPAPSRTSRKLAGPAARSSRPFSFQTLSIIHSDEDLAPANYQAGAWIIESKAPSA